MIYMTDILFHQLRYLCKFFIYVIPVVLLDTTTVLGELGWKTYPLNGVSLNVFLKLPSLLGVQDLLYYEGMVDYRLYVVCILADNLNPIENIKLQLEVLINGNNT